MGDDVALARRGQSPDAAVARSIFPHSLGLLYSAFTYYTGFKVNSGEYKLMGLAPYGEPNYVDAILDASDRPQGRRLVPAEHAITSTTATGLTMTNAQVRRAVRRAAARARVAADAARDGPRGVRSRW